MAGVRGDFAKLNGLIGSLGKLATPAFRAGIVKQMSIEAQDLVQESFRRAETPEGKAWKPLKRRRGRPLMDTRRLYNSISRRSTSTGFRVETNVIYAAPQNYGFPRFNVPARAFFPKGRLPPRWRTRLHLIAEAQMRRALRPR